LRLVEYALMLIKQAETGDAVARTRAEKMLRSALAIAPTNQQALYELGNLELNGMSEYDVMVGRCMDKFYHQWTRVHGNQPTYGGSFGG
jgi:hypothetical protein